ncbi:MAG: PQQ-dependent sugar dehydrogenase, partial [Acidobacteriota bacterium]
MKRTFLTALLVALLMALLMATLTPALRAETLPGFSVRKVAAAKGFLTSIAFDDQDRLFYSSRSGEVFRLDGTTSTRVALVPTANIGNAALLGIAFTKPDEIVAHYVVPDLSADILTSVNLGAGDKADQKELVRFVCDEGRPCPSEHHGGNLIVAPNGDIFFGIGDYGGGLVAQEPESTGGKIFRVSPDGEAKIFALGLRNPFDMALDPTNGKLLISDNGPVGGDEIDAASSGDNLGWPFTVGTNDPIGGDVPPIYTFPQTVAPTGVFYVKGPKPMAPGGLLVTAFVTKTLYYFPNIHLATIPQPLELVRGETDELIDVAQNSRGEIFFASGTGIYQLILPRAGDANGDGFVNDDDLAALAHEIQDSDGERAVNAQ